MKYNAYQECSMPYLNSKSFNDLIIIFEMTFNNQEKKFIKSWVLSLMQILVLFPPSPSHRVKSWLWQSLNIITPSALSMFVLCPFTVHNEILLYYVSLSGCDCSEDDGNVVEQWYQPANSMLRERGRLGKWCTCWELSLSQLI